MLAAGHQAHAEAAAVQDKPGRHQGNHRNQQEPVQRQGPHLEGEVGTVKNLIAVGGVDDLGRIGAVDALGNDHGQRRGQQVQRRTTDGLIRLQIDGGESKQGRIQQPRHRRGQHRHDHAQKCRYAPGVEQVDGHDAHQAADDHNSLQRDIDNAGALREHTAHGYQGQHGGIQQRIFQKKPH